MMQPTSSRTNTRSTAKSSEHRGNTLILVTAILVLLVIIATAYISRAQGGRAIASAQRKAMERVDRSEVAASVVSAEISGGLFPKLIQGANDPGIDLGISVATSSSPRLRVAQWRDEYGVVHKVERNGVDPQWYDEFGIGNVTTANYPYNFAPFETKAWTNWPDSSGGFPSALPIGKGNPAGIAVDGYGIPIGDSDPIGNPGFGDSRWLRSSEPLRSTDNAGRITGFSHWDHLSFPATAENGWRICYDIMNVAPYDPNITNSFDPIVNPEAGFTITHTTAEDFFLNGDLGGGYHGITQPVALQSPYEQWLGSFSPAPINTSLFTEDFVARRDQWFGPPGGGNQSRSLAVAGYAPTLPNLFRLNDLGPSRDEYSVGSKRNIVSRTFADTDGDGFTDSFWFLLPGVSEDGVRQVASVSVIDNASMVDLEVATRFDRFSTLGQTPADIALTSRLTAQQGGANPEADPLDSRTGLFSDPQNVWPDVDWGFGNSNDANTYFWGGDGDTFGAPAWKVVKTAYDPYAFGDDFSRSGSWLKRVGVLRQGADPGDAAPLEGPFQTLLAALPGGFDAGNAQFDRRRYFQMRQNDSRLYVKRRNLANNQPWFTSAYFPREFDESDELELRMFHGSNYSPIVSSLERTVNPPWDKENNLFRSTLTRPESRENWTEYGNPDTEAVWPPSSNDIDGDSPSTGGPYAPGSQLTEMQLLRDSRHRSTTYSATRNDLRPLWLRPTPLYQSQTDYLGGRASFSWLLEQANDQDDSNGGFPSVPETENEFGKLHIKANREGYEQLGQKIDLRGSLDRPLDAFEAMLYAGESGNGPYFPSPFDIWFEVPNASSTSNLEGFLPGEDSAALFSLQLDRAFRFRNEIQNTLDRTMGGYFRGPDNTIYAQSYLGDAFRNLPDNESAYLKTQLMNASWAANIDTFRDSRGNPHPVSNFADSAGAPTVETVFIDQPIYPDWGTRVSPDAFFSGIDPSLVNVTFTGMEKQPFIMETFFALAYPKSQMTNELKNELNDNELYRNEHGEDDSDEPPFPIAEDQDTIPEGFPDAGENWVDNESEPAIIFAIQLGNPFDDPVSLADVRLRIGSDDVTRNRPIILSKIPSPHPSAIDNSGGRLAPYYRPNELVLGPTLPDAPRTAIIFGIIPPDGVTGESFEDAFDLPYSEFHELWVDFLDLEPGNLFGYDANLSLPELQTLVFDASPRTYHRQSPDAEPQEYQPVVGTSIESDPEVWFNEDNEFSVELIRSVENPRTYDGTPSPQSYQYVIDRLDNDVAEDGTTNLFRDQMTKMLDQDCRPYMDQGALYNNNRKIWNGIRLKEDDFFVTWTRAGRAWGWDRNRNGYYDMNEVSPRYVYSHIPLDDRQTAREYESEDSAPPPEGTEGSDEPGGGGGGAGGTEFRAVTFKKDSDPDGDSTSGEADERYPWMTRSYLLPIATKASVGGGFSLDFETVRAKPVNFTTASALKTVAGGETREVDFDAGFPVFANGELRTGVDASGWPGQPAQSYQWAMMDKGQAPEETLTGDRSGQNGNYSRIWLERDEWAYPLQMLQKNADFDQVGEVANAFLWGHALEHRPGVTTTPTIFNNTRFLPTVATFGEIMNGRRVNDLFPIVRADLVSNGVPIPGRVHTNRWYADPGNLSGIPGSGSDPFSPYTQVLEVKGVDNGWTPLLPAGTGFFDSLVCDGPGSNHSLRRTGVADPVASYLGYQDDSFGNAAGFSGNPTRGLININTASPEVLRTLPHMSRLSYNDTFAWQNTQSGVWQGYTAANPIRGDVDTDGVPRDIAQRNNHWVRVPEMIARYRDGESMVKRVEQAPYVFGNSDLLASIGNEALPAYSDRGTLNPEYFSGGVTLAEWVSSNITYPSYGNTIGFFPGMRRDKGISSIGELMLLGRTGAFGTGGWSGSSPSIRSAALNPYVHQAPLTNIYGAQMPDGFGVDPLLLGIGWRSSGLGVPPVQADARLSTDVQHTSFRTFAGDSNSPSITVEIPDNVAMDAEESNMLFAGMSNLISTRSDTFTVYIKIRSFKQNAVSGVWNAMDPEYIVDDSRYVMVVDRSKCELPTDEPEIRLYTQVPN